MIFLTACSFEEPCEQSEFVEFGKRSRNAYVNWPSRSWHLTPVSISSGVFSYRQRILKLETEELQRVIFEIVPSNNLRKVDQMGHDMENYIKYYIMGGVKRKKYFRICSGIEP